MSLLTVVQDVCAVVGVDRPASVFANILNTRTMQEMLALANEMAQRIAYDTREWGALKRFASYPGTAANNSEPQQSEFVLPTDFKRLLLTSNLYRKSMPNLPLRFVSDQDEWLRRRGWGYSDYRGEWTILGNSYIAVAPQLPTTDTLSHIYLIKNCIKPTGGGENDVFIHDDDSFALNERLLKLGMIWQWKANKGSPYAEDLSNYETALAVEAGHDVPAPIIVDRLPISWSANVAYPWPPGWGPTP